MPIDRPATADCVVIGAGIAGLLSARFIRRHGLSVAVFERGEAGRESSWAGGGIVSPLIPWCMPPAIGPLVRRSQSCYAGLCAELADETGIDPEWTQSGMLVLDPVDRAVALDWAGHNHVPIGLVEGGTLRAMEPALAPATEALSLPNIAQVRNPCLVRALRTSLAENGVAIHERRPVERILTHNDRVIGIATADGREWHADRVVVTAGAWSGRLVTVGGRPLPVEPVRGQMLLFRPHPGLLRHIVLRGDRYLIPRRDGRILAGSTLESAGFDKRPTAGALADLLSFATATLPALGDADIEAQWAGLRPGSPGGIPWIGEHPEVSGFFVNTGHFRNGVVMAPASAELIAGLVTGETSRIDPAPYALPGAAHGARDSNSSDSRL